MLDLGLRLFRPVSGLPIRDPGTFSSLWTIVGAEVTTPTTSRTITLSDIGTDAVITVIAGTTYSINGGTFTAIDGVISDGDTIKVTHTSSGLYETLVSGGVIIGGVTCAFSITTIVVLVSALEMLNTVEMTSGLEMI